MLPLLNIINLIVWASIRCARSSTRLGRARVRSIILGQSIARECGRFGGRLARTQLLEAERKAAEASPDSRLHSWTYSSRETRIGSSVRRAA